MTGILFDKRRQEMRALGFETCQLRFDRESRKLLAVAYRYVGDDLTEDRYSSKREIPKSSRAGEVV